MQAVIICGGKGSRLKSVTGNNPKALVKFNGKENLKNQIKIFKIKKMAGNTILSFLRQF